MNSNLLRGDTGYQGTVNVFENHKYILAIDLNHPANLVGKGAVVNYCPVAYRYICEVNDLGILMSS